MSISHTKLFKSNTSQAVRLAKSIALPDNITNVDIVADGNFRIISPAGEAWDYWFDNKAISDDFMLERNQEPDQQRDGF